MTSWFKYVPTQFWFLDVQTELFLFIRLFRDLSAVQSWSERAVLAQLSHVDSLADAAGWFGWGPVGQSDPDHIEGKVQALAWGCFGSRKILLVRSVVFNEKDPPLPQVWCRSPWEGVWGKPGGQSVSPISNREIQRYQRALAATKWWKVCAFR